MAAQRFLLVALLLVAVAAQQDPKPIVSEGQTTCPSCPNSDCAQCPTPAQLLEQLMYETCLQSTGQPCNQIDTDGRRSKIQWLTVGKFGIPQLLVSGTGQVLYSTGMDPPKLVSSDVVDTKMNNRQILCPGASQIQVAVQVDATTQLALSTTRSYSYASTVGGSVKFKIPIVDKVLGVGLDVETSTTTSFSDTSSTTTTTTAGQTRRAILTLPNPTDGCMAVQFYKKMVTAKYTIGTWTQAKGPILVELPRGFPDLNQTATTPRELAQIGYSIVEADKLLFYALSNKVKGYERWSNAGWQLRMNTDVVFKGVATTFAKFEQLPSNSSDCTQKCPNIGR